MTMQYVRDTYGVPAKRGRRVQVYDERGELLVDGRITRATHYVWLGPNRPCHPTWNAVYLADDGSVLLDTRETKP